ncbi:MAG: BatA domain-containing protein [Ekhidna sp.]
MGVLLPYFLIGLAALVIPVIVHLWSKNTRNSVAFGSIRFLKETETKTMRSIMPSQWILLLLRLLLMFLLVLLLAEPFLNSKKASINTMYLVDLRYADLAWFQPWKDSLNEDDEAFWLVDGFPSIDQKIEYANNDYWQLLANPPTLKAERIVVISPLRMKDFKSSMVPFPNRYEWMKLPTEPQTEQIASYEIGDKQYQVTATFDEWKTTNSYEETLVNNELTVSYYLKSSEEYAKETEIFKAAFHTLDELSPISTKPSENLLEADWVFWLSNEQPPKRSNMLMIDSVTIQTWKQVTDDRIHISNDWSLKDAVELNLPKKLLALLSPSFNSQQDQRTMDVRAFKYTDESIERNVQEQESAASIFWMLLLVVLVVERWASFKSETR